MLFFYQTMQEDLKQAHHLAEMYRKQCVTLETELAQIREEGDVGRELFKVQWLYACLQHLNVTFINKLTFLFYIFKSIHAYLCRIVQTKWPNAFS